MNPDIKTLKEAFALARETRNIDYILPVFLSAHLYVVAKSVPEDTEPSIFLTPSPASSRLSVTVSESRERFDKISSIALLEMTGRELLSRIGPGHEIVVGYSDGADILTKEHLDYYRSILKP